MDAVRRMFPFGYKTASAVHKRIAKIANAYEDFVTAEYQKYLDK